MRRKLKSPLPQRYGLDPVRLKLPAEGPWATVREHLIERLPTVAPERIDLMFHEERVVDMNGTLAMEAPFVPNSFIWFHRDLPIETPVPFEVTVVHWDETLLVVDKPHFLATTPRGKHVLETALIRLRRHLDLPDLSPAHRLDRVTAGLVMFVIRPEHRGAYQRLFHDRKVRKEYEAIAPVDAALELPRTVRSRIIKERGILAAQEVPGESNSETHVQLEQQRGDLGRYRLRPETGRTHQLRVHMNGLGIPILGDDYYPTLSERPEGDFSRPLQLLARTLEFRDPLTGEERRFESRLRLRAWGDPDSWATEHTAH